MAKPSRLSQETINEYLKKGLWETTTWGDIWDRNAKLYPNREALVDRKSRLTWRQAKQWIDRVALGFLELGIKKDDAIVFQLPNWVELAMLRVACEKAGAVCCPILRTMREKDVEYILGYLEAVGIVIPWRLGERDYFEMIQSLRPKLPALKYVFIVGDDVPEGAISLKEMSLKPLEKKYPADYLKQTDMPATEVSVVMLTSGTTGFPKFVEHPIAARVAVAKGRAELHKYTKDDVFAALSPTGGGPSNNSYLVAPFVGAKSIWLETFDPEEALKLMEKEKVNYPGAVPAQFLMIVNHPDFDKYDLSAVREIPFEAAPSTGEVKNKVAEKFHWCHMTAAYGAVDFGGTCEPSPDDPPEVTWNTVGKPLAGTQIKLVDGEGREVPKGEIGEVMGAGPTCSSGYYKDPEATWQAWSKDGWFKFGDLGRWDEQGNLVLVGRSKDMIIRGGQNIYPKELENLLITHPQVADVAVVAMPDPVLHEKACAYVVPKPGQTFTFDEMTRFLRGKQITSFKLPERLEIVARLPMTDVHKVDKKVLQADIANKLKAEAKK